MATNANDTHAEGVMLGNANADHEGGGVASMATQAIGPGNLQAVVYNMEDTAAASILLRFSGDIQHPWLFNKFVLCFLDDSGSMKKFQRMEYAKQGLKAQVKYLWEKGMRNIRMYRYSTKCSEIPFHNIPSAEVAIDSVQPRYKTSFVAPLQSAIEELRGLPDGAMVAVVFFTDGKDVVDTTPNKSRVAAKLHELRDVALTKRITLEIHAVGIGSSHDALLLSTLVEGGTSDGSYQRILNPSKELLPGIDAITGLITQTNVSARVVTDAGATNAVFMPIDVKQPVEVLWQALRRSSSGEEEGGSSGSVEDASKALLYEAVLFLPASAAAGGRAIDITLNVPGQQPVTASLPLVASPILTTVSSVRLSLQYIEREIRRAIHQLARSQKQITEAVFNSIAARITGFSNSLKALQQQIRKETSGGMPGRKGRNSNDAQDNSGGGGGGGGGGSSSEKSSDDSSGIMAQLPLDQKLDLQRSLRSQRKELLQKSIEVGQLMHEFYGQLRSSLNSVLGQSQVAALNSLVYAGKLKGGLQKLLDKRVVRNAQLWDQVEERVKGACEALPLAQLGKAEEAKEAPGDADPQWLCVFHRAQAEGGKAAEASEGAEGSGAGIDPAVAWNVFESEADAAGTLACFYTQSSVMELMEDGDCLCLGLETSIPPAAIAEPTQLRVHSMGPSLVSGRSFLDAAEFSYAPGAGDQGPGSGSSSAADSEYPPITKPGEVAAADAGSGSTEKTAAPLPGQEPKPAATSAKQVVLSRDRGRSAAAAVLVGTAREPITAALPLYIHAHHWSIAKHLMKPLLGWTATSNPLGYDKVQLAAVPFLVLGKTIDNMLQSASANNRRMLGLALDTACAVVRDYHWLFEQGSFAAAAHFGKDFSARTKDKVPSIRVFLMHVLTKRLLSDVAVASEEEGAEEGKTQGAEAGKKEATVSAAATGEQEGEAPPPPSFKKLLLDCTPQAFIHAAADEGLRRVLKPAEDTAAKMGVTVRAVSEGRDVAGLTQGDALLLQVLQLPLSKYLFPVLDAHSIKMSRLLSAASGAANPIAAAGKGSQEAKEEKEEEGVPPESSLSFPTQWPKSGPLAVLYAQLDARFTEALEPLLRVVRLVLDKGWAGVETFSEDPEAALGSYSGLDYTGLSPTGQAALLVQNMQTVVNADRRAAIERGGVEDVFAEDGDKKVIAKIRARLLEKLITAGKAEINASLQAEGAAAGAKAFVTSPELDSASVTIRGLRAGDLTFTTYVEALYKKESLYKPHPIEKFKMICEGKWRGSKVTHDGGWRPGRRHCNGLLRRYWHMMPKEEWLKPPFNLKEKYVNYVFAKQGHDPATPKAPDASGRGRAALARRGRKQKP